MKSLFISLIIVILSLIAFIAGPWLLLYMGLSSTEDPPKPAYTYGEFPFFLEYEINGQVRIVEDKVIVKYDGIGLSTGSGGKYINWKQTLASGNDEVVLFVDGELERIIFTVREVNYHLEDELHNEETEVPNLIKEVRDERGGTSSSLYYDTKIKLLNFEYGEPLKK